MVLECGCGCFHREPGVVCLVRAAMAGVRQPFKAMVAGTGASRAVPVSAMYASACFLGGLGQSPSHSVEGVGRPNHLHADRVFQHQLRTSGHFLLRLVVGLSGRLCPALSHRGEGREEFGLAFPFALCHCRLRGVLWIACG